MPLTFRPPQRPTTHIELTCRYCGNTFDRAGSCEDVRILLSFWFARHKHCKRLDVTRKVDAAIDGAGRRG